MPKYACTQITALTLLCIRSVFAFTPPVDTLSDITLSLEGFEDLSDNQGLSVSKFPADTPLSITVAATNNRTNLVQGTLQVWMNDDWDIADGKNVAVEIKPGTTWRRSFTATAKLTVLNALYPVHAELTTRNPAITLHPIAVFEAVKTRDTNPRPPLVGVLPDQGAFRLDSDVAYRVFYQQSEAVVDLGTEFLGQDENSGLVMAHDTTTRNSIKRRGFSVHPPYRGGTGVTWSEFKLILPDRKPLAFQSYTAIRDHASTEPTSDGTEHKVFVIGADGIEHELFSRFSASKTWEPASVDLSPYAGESITLRLWTGPGPKNDPTCDLCYWGDPTITIGTLPSLQTEAEWQSLDTAAVERARQAVHADSVSGIGTFQLHSNGTVLGAGIVLGKQGLTDGVLAFSDGFHEIIYRGFACDIDEAPVGGVENGNPVLEVESSFENGVWSLTHRLASQPQLNDRTRAPQTVFARARIWVEGGALRLAWDLPDTPRNAQGNPRYTRLGLGPAQLPVWRVYAGFGNVIENPGPFELHAGGFDLSTRHVGADYTNGLSLLQAADVFPDRLTFSPATHRFALEAHHNAAFFFIPSTNGAFAAAREYSTLSGFKKGPGVDRLFGRLCLDQWGGDYLTAAEDIKEAARYGVTNAVFVKHAWQKWGYDYRLPEIDPPSGGLEPFLAMRNAARDAGMLFCPHDNYIDFYPDAAGFSYDHIVFNQSGEPVKAWYNKGRGAQSYRWLPHAFAPWMKTNMFRMKSGFSPDSLFIDVFSAIAPFDYYDRRGVFHPATSTAQEWRNAFDTCRNILGNKSPMISEAGTDALIGSLDAGQADHFSAQRWIKNFDDSNRTPWHDMATHGKMILFAGGLGSRYGASDWDKESPSEHGYGSDDYLSNTVIGGRNPMCDGPFSRRAVMTYWLLHDVCDALSRQQFETHDFGETIQQQHTTFSNRGSVWTNRGTNLIWNVAGGNFLPEYGFYAKTPEVEAGIVMIDGQRAAFAQSRKTFFADARPLHNSAKRMQVESSTREGFYLGNGVFDVTFNWNVLTPSFTGYVPFLHLCNDTLKDRESGHIAFQSSMQFDHAFLQRQGHFTATSHITVPHEMPAGDYQIRYGLFNPTTGHRLPIQGTTDETSRIRGGILRVEKQGDRLTSGTFISETESTEARKLGQNIENKMLDFGPVITDGAFRLVYENAQEWQLIPLPGSRPFRAEIKMGGLGPKNQKVKSVENIDPFYPAAPAPEWSQDGTTLRLSCDAQAFAYKIVFD